MKSTAAQLAVTPPGRNFGWVDAVVLLALIGLFWSALHVGRGMLVHFDAATMPALDPSPAAIPGYAARTLLRMWIAFGFSLLFAVAVGYLAAKNRVARALIVPALDVLQSVPVLGFLSATVTGFMALFPGSLLGVECASIFAIFTSQVWNMAFGFHHALVSIPAEMQEAATVSGLNRWQRLRIVELPSAAHSLIWNGMMSFGGGWFFVAQSEAISVMNRDIKLPGLGSYMALALERGDTRAALFAVAAMLVLILVSDQLVWRPLLAWAERFKNELTESGSAPRSWVYELLRGAYVFTWLDRHLRRPLADALVRLRRPGAVAAPRPAWTRHAGRVLGVVLLLWLGVEAVSWIAAAVAALHGALDRATLLQLAGLGGLTALRVTAMVVFASLVWTPIGVWIGLKPAVARFAQPLAQIGASFPVNMTFPWAVGFFVAHRVSLDWGSIALLAMGTQWYILFNVVAGASAIPNDLKEAARMSGLRGWALWRTLILPAVFPAWVTGACTAAGGAWNASIVAELASWGDTTLRAQGLGAFIADVTRRGDTPLIVASIAVMSLFVVATNKLVWRPLYAYAERRFKLE
ncbi:MAG: ABC transporter permease subunit [Rubrivivax sp.]